MPHILVVEDDQFLSAAYKLKLEKEEFTVSLAQDGQEALDMLQTLTPDLILLDLVMPIKDGFAVLSDLKESEKLRDIPVIIASNLGQDEEIKRGIAMGAVDYIVKSNTSLEEIVQKIEMIGDNKSGLYMLDNELGARVAAPAVV